MGSISIDFQNDPEIPRGRELLEDLVGAHMSAETEEELQLFVSHAMNDLLSDSPSGHPLRVMTHAAYRGQILIVRLLSLATRQRLAMEQSGIDVDPAVRQRNPQRFRDTRLKILSEVQDDLNFSQH
jgi:hypothetical protein